MGSIVWAFRRLKSQGVGRRAVNLPVRLDTCELYSISANLAHCEEFGQFNMAELAMSNFITDIYFTPDDKKTRSPRHNIHTSIQTNNMTARIILMTLNETKRLDDENRTH